LRQLEFLGMIESMLSTREIRMSEGDRSDSLKIVHDINDVLKKYYYNYIVDEIEDVNCGHPSECGYDSWYCFFGDTDGSVIEDYMRLLFTEDECDRLWQQSHYK